MTPKKELYFMTMAHVVTEQLKIEYGIPYNVCNKIKGMIVNELLKDMKQRKRLYKRRRK